MNAVSPDSAPFVRLMLALGLVACVGPVPGAAAQTAAKVGLGNGTLYVGAYSNDILAIDEATEKVTPIHLKTGFPYSVRMSNDASRLYALNADMEHMEVVDTRARQSVDTFTLSGGGKRVRIRGYAVDPQQRFMVMGIQTVEKQVDRYKIEPSQLVLYDLTTHAVVKTVLPPGGEEARFNLRYSPDGALVYVFGREVVILNATTLEEVDRWDMSRPIEPGMGAGTLGSQDDNYEDPAYFTALFTIQDPVANRRIWGVGRVDLAKRSVDFAPIGPTPEGLRLSFAVSPDHKRGYILAQNIDDYQMWLVDIDGRRLEKKIPFDGRPRMAIAVSSSGQVIYIYEAGRTIDLYNAADFTFLRTLTMDTDMTYNSFHVVPAGGRQVGGARP